jgi:hypothetical protein
MKNSHSRLLAPAIAALFVCAGCRGTPVKFPTVAEKNPANYDMSSGRTVSGSKSGFQLLLFIPIGTTHRHEAAYNQLLANADDDLITDIKIEDSWTYALVGTIYTTKMEATAYPRKSVGEGDTEPAQSPPLPLAE